MIRVIVITPGETYETCGVEVAEIDGSLESFQGLVGGYIESVAVLTSTRKGAFSGLPPTFSPRTSARLPDQQSRLSARWFCLARATPSAQRPSVPWMTCK